MSNSDCTNPYDSYPTFDDHSSVYSSDTPHPIDIPPLNRNQSPLPPYSLSPLHHSTIMPSYTTNHKTDNKIEILSSNTNNQSTAKTQMQPIILSKITNSTSTSLSSSISIFQNISCGNYVFDIDYYVKYNETQTSPSSDREPNTLIIAISQKQRSRGTKRKASQSNDNQFNKKRRLNNSQSQSYSINNGSDPFNINDSINNYNNIHVKFTVNIGASMNDPNPYNKEFRCQFGENDDSNDLLCDWELDSDCDNNPSVNAFRTLSFDDLSNKVTDRITQTMQNSDNKIPKQQCIYISCSISIIGMNNNNITNNNNGFNGNNNFNNNNKIFLRHIFSHRAVTKFVGLKNEGATCYMNSMLQTLYHIAALRRNVYKIPVGHEAKQKKKKEEENKQKMNGHNTVTNANAMDVCHNENDINVSDDDDDDDDDYKKKKKRIKPPISLELQRLFYQLQTGAESNHQDEYSISKKSKNNDMDDGNNSDCSVFELKSDNEFNGNNSTNDDDVDMNQSMDLPSNSSSDLLSHWNSSYDKAVSTSNLIKSFGWSGSDAFVQHDVQEFLRVLMDKIEAKVKCTPAEKIVEKLFSGEYQSYVSCKNVPYESVRNENFQDIQLTIPKNNNNSSNRSSWSRYSSNNTDNAPDIYDCIRKFIEPEALDGDNQYYANDELKKQDADKGLRFKLFPPVLFLQLCRFEIDHYQHTSKINDPVKFYEDIDLNPFVYVEKKKNDDEKKETKDNKCEDIEYNRCSPNEYYNHLPSDTDNSGEFSYQLFSVLVHSGSTYGGHYFAYINPSGNKWYKFDDENVTIVSSEEATRKQFGGSSRQSAYMLVYIQKQYAKQILGEINEVDIPFGLRKYFSAEKEKQTRMRLEEIENSKKCNISYMNGHDMIYEDICGDDNDKIAMGDYNDDNNNELYVNVLDMGMKTLLKRKSIYKDIQFKYIYKDWCDEYNIKLENLLIYNYTERKNKTLRTNRQISIHYDEDNKKDDTDTYSQDKIKRHKIDTTPTEKYAKSIYDRIGNITDKKRMFILFDKSKIQQLGSTQKSNNNNGVKSKTILMALKYFDIFEQKLYFVDWILVKTDNIKFSDVMKYIEHKLTIETKDNRCYFDVLYNYCKEINEWELKTGTKYYRFIMCEEEAVLKNKGTRDNILCKVNDINLDHIITNEYFDGDIFIFQLNAYHPYFDTLKAGTKNIPNIKQLMNKNNNGNGADLSLKMKIIKREFNIRGMHWYDNVEKFLKSQLTMTNIELKVRENTGWKTRWTHALALQYKNDNGINIEQDIDKDLKKKLFKSKHKWKVEKRTSYGMIRKKLGNYYNINANHIEIWLPQNTYGGYSDKWDYGSKGRGKCSAKLESLLTDGRHEWNELCSLKFEIQTYKMTDFDAMTAYESQSGFSYSNTDVSKFGKRIKELAMFNFAIIAPNRAANNCGNMTMSFCKNWTGKSLANGIMKEVIENPIFGYTFFSKIVEYIRNNEIDSSSDKYIDDISILKSLTPDRFLICDEENTRLPSEYYMNKQYKMPNAFSQIKYTDFRVQFLAKNDPLVLNKNNKIVKKDENKIDIDYDDSDNEMDIDNDKNDNNDQTKWITKALWVYIKKYNAYGQQKSTNKIRIVIKKGESLKDVILKYLKSYLKIDYNSLNSSKQSSLSIDMKDDKKDKDNNKENDNDKENENGKSNDDILFEQICETHKFHIKGSNSKVKKSLLENAGVIDDIKPKMYLIIQLPHPKKKSMNSYDKPLKIAD